MPNSKFFIFDSEIGRLNENILRVRVDNLIPAGYGKEKIILNFGVDREN